MKKYHRILVPLILLIPEKNPLSEISEKWSWLIQARIHEKNPITRKEKSFFFQAIAFNYAMLKKFFFDVKVSFLQKIIIFKHFQ